MSNGGRHPLDGGRGTTVVEEAVVTSLVSVVVRESEKVRPSVGETLVPGDASPTVGEFLSSLTDNGDMSRGVTVELDGREAAVHLVLTLPYGEPIPRATRAVRDAVIRHAKALAGIDVTEVDIIVADVSLPGV